LNDSLGAFDAELRKEQQKVAQERDARQAAAGSATTEGQSGDKGAADRTGDRSGTAATEAPDTSTGARGDAGKRDPNKKSPRPGDLKSDKNSTATGGGATGNGATAREIPDGSDDDIVARRLRKAAEQETDPELKEKLWKEYVDYKKNAQGR